VRLVRWRSRRRARRPLVRGCSRGPISRSGRRCAVDCARVACHTDHDEQRAQDERDPRAPAPSARDDAASTITPASPTFTRPIAQGKQLVQRKGNRWTLALLALVVIAALLGALFVLPVQAWLRQEDDLTAKRAQLAVLDNANSQLEIEVDRLQTDEGAKEAARDELGLVAPGEIRVSMLDVADAPATLPPGWPYDAVTQILRDARGNRHSPPPVASIPASQHRHDTRPSLAGDAARRRRRRGVARRQPAPRGRGEVSDPPRSSPASPVHYCPEVHRNSGG
jgi:cell division protein FtsB